MERQYSYERDYRVKNKAFWSKAKPRISERYTGGKSEWYKIRKWEAKN